MNLCPCGRPENYQNCCALYIEQNTNAPNPETLMRSRYTAYYFKHMGYIQKTMRGKPLLNFDPQMPPPKSLRWIKLLIINSSISSQNSHQGFVEFIAFYLENNQLKSLHERSEFQQIEGLWFYVDGEIKATTPKALSRNIACPCGSLKKFKNCHFQK